MLTARSFFSNFNILQNPSALERIKERIVANGSSEPLENLLNINRSLFQAYCYNEDLDNALRIKEVRSMKSILAKEYSTACLA